MTLINIGLCKLVVEKFTHKRAKAIRDFGRRTRTHHLTGNASECNKRKMERTVCVCARVKENVKMWQLFSTF